MREFQSLSDNFFNQNHFVKQPSAIQSLLHPSPSWERWHPAGLQIFPFLILFSPEGASTNRFLTNFHGYFNTAVFTTKVMTDNILLDKFYRFVGQTSPFPPTLQVRRAQGSYIHATNGKRYLDFISGIAVTNVGHSHPALVQAVQKQAAQYAHTMVYGEHVQEPQVLLAEKIVSVAPKDLDCVYFLTTGAEANDAALKLAAKKTGRSRFVAFNGAYHGDTVGAMSCFGSGHFRNQFGALLADVTFLPFGDIAALDQIDTDIAAILIEPVQGEGGIRLPPDGFLARLRQKCDQTGALLIFDEVQTGFGRTGQWFAAETYCVDPDIITMAKGMGAGFPLAGVLASRQMLYDFAANPAFSHITTFGGHPVSCAAGHAAMQIIENENLLENCRKKGEWLQTELREAVRQTSQPTTVRGIGLMIGVETPTPEIARQIVDTCRENGLILETNLLNEAVIRLSPPLNITTQECQEALEIFKASIPNK